MDQDSDEDGNEDENGGSDEDGDRGVTPAPVQWSRIVW